jgi:hypothetical protein
MLEATLADLEAQMDNITIAMGGHSFKLVDDCEAFILHHVPGNTFAYFYNIVSLLHRAWGNNHIGVCGIWENNYELKKAGFTPRGKRSS